MQRRVHDYPVDDGAVLMGRFRGGALGLLQVAYNCPDTYPRRTLELIGTRARALACKTMGQTPGGTLTLTDAATGVESAVPLSPEEDRSPFLHQVEAFSTCVLEGRPFPFAPERDVRLLCLLGQACEPRSWEDTSCR
jgi:predicted dehydrogenase